MDRYIHIFAPSRSKVSVQGRACAWVVVYKRVHAAVYIPTRWPRARAHRSVYIVEGCILTNCFVNQIVNLNHRYSMMSTPKSISLTSGKRTRSPPTRTSAANSSDPGACFTFRSAFCNQTPATFRSCRKLKTFSVGFVMIKFDDNRRNCG